MIFIPLYNLIMHNSVSKYEIIKVKNVKISLIYMYIVFALFK